MSIIPSQDTSGNQLFLPSTSNISDISLISIYWSDILGKPSFCNVAITANYNDLINLPSISSSVIFNGDYNSLSNLSWINSNSNIYFFKNGNVGIGTTNPNNKLHLIGNFSIEGNIIPSITSNFNLGSSNFKWKDLYLSGNSIFLDNLVLTKNNSNNLEIKDSNGNLKNLNLNSIELNNLNDKIILSLSNQQLIFNSNGTIYNSINFNNYSNIIYSNVFSNTSNSIVDYINLKINNINTDNIFIGNSNKFISSNIYSNNLTITSNLFINGDYYYKNQLLPFTITSNTSIITSNGLFSYINNCNFGYYIFLTNGSITFPKTTLCDVLVVGAGGNGGIGSFSGGGGAGEVISYPNYNFNQGTYNIKIGLTSFNSNDKISSISSNNSIILNADGGDDGSFSYSNIIISNTTSNLNISNNFSIYYNNNIIGNSNSGIYSFQFNDTSINIYNVSTITSIINIGVQNLSGIIVNPIAWYKFENSTTLGLDSMGNNTLGTISGNANYNSTIKKYGNGSIYLTGGWITGVGANINNKTYSISVWLYRVSAVDCNIYDSDGGFGGYYTFLFGWYSSNWIYVNFYGPEVGYTDTTLNQWVHYTFTYNPTGYVMKLYRNGILVSTNTSGTQVYNTGSSSTTYSIGRRYGGTGSQQSGNNLYIDDFRIYNIELSSNQILSILNQSININLYNNLSTTNSGNGSGGGSYSNLNTNINKIFSGTKLYSYATNGSNGTLIKGGNGGSALSNIGFTSLITGTSLIIGQGGIGATSNSVPRLNNTYGSGGDGNGGLGTQGIIIIKTPLDSVKSSFDGYINYNNLINKPIINDLFATTNFINIGFNNQLNFPLGDVAWANEWFLYIGISPTLVGNSFIFWHLTSNINSKWWFNGTTATTNAEISDNRIKKEITNIENPIDKLMALQPKEYYLCDDKDYLKKYGILAQDVYSNQDLKHLVYQDEEYIANIYTNANYNNKIITTKITIIDKIEINDELKILIDNNNENKEIIIEDLPYHNRYKKRYIKVKEILNDYSFEIYEEIEIMEQEKDKIFIYGKKVKDFLKLDYSSLYSLNIDVNKQLYLLVKKQQEIIEELKNNLNQLKNM